MWIEQPPTWYRGMYPGAMFRQPSGKTPGVVYLTFDDGPIPEVTPWVLDTLDKYDVKATFFMVGQNIERYPLLLEDVRSRGHKVGNHTLHHMKGFRVSKDIYLEDVSAGERLTESRLFRPPHGLIKPSQLREIRKRNSIIMYDVVTRDYSQKLTVEDVVDNVRRYTRDGSIIVFHDSLKSFPRLEKALPESIEWLKGEGYVFDVLKEPEIA